MNFEDLPNELHCGLFGYFHSIDLFQAFYGLNERFNQLLIQFPAHHVDFRGVSRVHFTHFCRQYLPRILPEVHSVCLSNGDSTPGLAEDFIAHGFTLDQFVQLRSLTLDSFGRSKLVNEMIFQCMNFSHGMRLRLIALSLYYEDEPLDRIWSLPSLKSYTGCFTTFSDESQIQALTEVSSSIERLALIATTHRLDTLAHILRHTPELRHLTVTIYHEADTEPIAIPRLRLRSLHLSYKSESTEDLIALFRQMPNLRRMKLNTENLSISGREFEKIVVTYLPTLECFQLNMNFRAPPGTNRAEVADEPLSTFQSSFWTEEKKWFVRREWSSDEHQYYMRLSTIS